MTTTLTDDEFALLSNLPTETIVDLAAELGILAPVKIDRRNLLDLALAKLIEHARRDGLPFSKYDADDLAALSQDDLNAIGELQGIRGKATVHSILKRGARVYKQFADRRNDHPIPLMLPMLLTAVARGARTR